MDDPALNPSEVGLGKLKILTIIIITKSAKQY
jgi:hypothetical protein